MIQPPVPVLMLYDPEEFWAAVRTAVREEIAAIRVENTLIQSAIEKAGLPLKPAYSLAEIKILFQTRGRNAHQELDQRRPGAFALPAAAARTDPFINRPITLFHAK